MAVMGRFMRRCVAKKRIDVMTPFGEKIRALRQEKGATQAEMAFEVGVSAPYLSALEHGRRGRPSWPLVQRIIGYFGLIWDDAEDLEKLARLSHPKVTIDTSGLSAEATELANRLADRVDDLEEADISTLLEVLRPR